MIKALTGLIIAITGLLALLHQAGYLGTSSNSTPTTDEEALETYKAVQKETPKCYTFAAKHFDNIPYSLYYSLKDSKKVQDFMYWFHIQGKNNCPHRLEIIVSFQSLREKPLVESIYTHEDPLTYIIDPGEPFDEKLHPGFKFLTDDVDDTLEVRWEILQIPGKKRLESGNSHIQVRSKNKFVWNLRTPESAQVSKDFILASLTAWTLSRNLSLRERSEQLLQSLDPSTPPSLFTKNFIERCYNDIFHGAQKVTITPSANMLPPADSELSIRTPSQILKRRQADPLEAALLVAALGQKYLKERRGVSLVLFAMPRAAALPSRQSILLAWHVGFGNWHAIDMTRVNEMAFADNLSWATEQINALLSEQTVLESLKDDGVFYRQDRQVVAVDFARAKEKFGIKSLP